MSNTKQFPTAPCLTLSNFQDNRITTDTPYLTLPGELWGVYCEDFGENWPCYIGTAVYMIMMMIMLWNAAESYWWLNLWYLLKRYAFCLIYGRSDCFTAYLHTFNSNLLVIEAGQGTCQGSIGRDENCLWYHETWMLCNLPRTQFMYPEGSFCVRAQPMRDHVTL